MSEQNKQHQKNILMRDKTKIDIQYLIPLISLVLIFAYACNPGRERTKAGDLSWIRFEWEGDSIGGRYFDKLAMFVPFQIEGIPYRFTAQLDLGAPMTMIYGNTFVPLLEAFPGVAEKLDTVHKNYVIQGKKVGEFRNISFFLDTVKFMDQEVAFFEGFGDSASERDLRKDTVIHIGTVGANLFRNKILVIDFRNRRMAIADTLTDVDESDLIDIVIEHGRVKVPVMINGEKVYVLYDSGTSFATLFLSTRNWDPYRDTLSAPDTIMATAWGTKYPLLISKTNIEIKIGSMSFHPETIMANDLVPYYEFYKKENIIGLMGNQLFYDKILIIDFKHNRFGLAEGQ
jgi:hypothetical protein